MCVTLVLEGTGLGEVHSLDPGGAGGLAALSGWALVGAGGSADGGTEEKAVRFVNVMEPCVCLVENDGIPDGDGQIIWGEREAIISSHINVMNGAVNK